MEVVVVVGAVYMLMEHWGEVQRGGWRTVGGGGGRIWFVFSSQHLRELQTGGKHAHTDGFTLRLDRYFL